MKPSFDEDRAKEEALRSQNNPTQIAEILSKGKANSAHSVDPAALIIAGDQLVHFQGEIIGKSKNFETAFQQLKKMNDKTHELITAVTLINDQDIRHINHITQLKMKRLEDDEIKNYVDLDRPFDCAGSYKIEEHGIALFERIECSDFTAIQGLPMIWLSNQLKELGYELFKR